MADRLFRLWMCLLVVNCLAPKTGYCLKVSMNPYTWSSARERAKLWVPRIKYSSFDISVEEEPPFSIPANQTLWVGHYLSYKYFTYLGCSIPAPFPMNEVKVPKEEIGFCQSGCNTPYIGQRVRDKACVCVHTANLANQTDCSDTDSENLHLYKELPDGNIEENKLEDKADQSTACLFVEFMPTAYERWELRDCTESRGTWCAKGREFHPSGGTYSLYEALSVCGSGSKLPQISPRYRLQHAIDTWTALKRDLVVRNTKVAATTPRVCGYIERKNTTSAIHLLFENCETSKRFIYSDPNEDSGEGTMSSIRTTSIHAEDAQTTSGDSTPSLHVTTREPSILTHSIGPTTPTSISTSTSVASTLDDTGTRTTMLLVAVIVLAGLLVAVVSIVLACVICRRKRTQATCTPHVNPGIDRADQHYDIPLAASQYEALTRTSSQQAEAGYYEIAPESSNRRLISSSAANSDQYDKVYKIMMAKEQALTDSIDTTTLEANQEETPGAFPTSSDYEIPQ